MRTERSAHNDPAMNVGWLDLLDTKFDIAIGQKDRVAWLYFIRQGLQRDRCPMFITADIMCRKNEVLSGLKVHHTAADDADTNLRALEILEDGDGLVQSFAHTLHLAHEFSLVL